MHDVTEEIIEETVRENDMTRLQRFKKWAKENIVTLSVVAIMTAS